MKDMFFSVKENNIKKEYEIIKNVKYKDNNYIIYKDDKDVYASRYEIISNEIVLYKIDDEDVWNYLDELMEE